MYIKSITIDGFKSYAKKTEISGFDPLFNAITGLNGSGKSNILDSICFLLGITNLSQVRASNLQELVYKNGQAGVTKATVSILFDNKDKKQSPVGYEQYDEFTVTRQVVVGGRNKYLINGCNATNTRVADLFRSVQLNVNNPHFLIMQGRITKVLNMKPPEILAMIEEATGTRMYETKKQSAQKTIEKKDAKLNEINTILNEEITPTLERLKAERMTYMEFTKVSRELDHLNKLYIAWKFVQTQAKCEKSSETLDGIKELIASHNSAITEIQNKMKALKEQIGLLERKKDEEAGGTLAQLEEELKEKRMVETKVTSDLNHVKDALKQEQKNRAKVKKSCEEDRNTMQAKQKELDKLKNMLSGLEEVNRKNAEALCQAQKHFQAVSAGLSSNDDGEEATIADQLMCAKAEVARLDTEMKQASMKLKHAQDEVRKKLVECKKTEDTYKKDQVAYSNAETQLRSIQAQLAKLDYSENREEALLSRKRVLVQEMEALEEKIDVLEARYPHLKFEYEDPEPNFDRRKVHGLVCQLIGVKKPDAATALEVTAGGRLYNIVVDTEVTGKKLLEKGHLKRRYTIIPLNKIDGRTIDAGRVKRAEKMVGSENVSTALSLINYTKGLDAAMKYVFGGAFVCPDMEVAKKVAFAEGIQTKAVTLQGEVFDPSGTLTGGSRAQGECILLKVAEIKNYKDSLNRKKEQLQEVEDHLAAMRKTATTYRNLKQQLETKEGEVEILRARMEQCTHHQQMEEIKRLSSVIETEEATLARCKEQKQKAETRAKDLEMKIKDAKAFRERELKAAEEGLKKAKKNAEDTDKQFRERQQEVEVMRLEVEELQKGIANYEEQMKAIDDGMHKCEEKMATINEALAKAKEDATQTVSRLNKTKEHLKAQDAEISKLNKQYDVQRKEAEEKKLAVQQLQHDIERTQSEAKEANKALHQMLESHDWIRSEKEFFGVANTEYDFSAFNPSEVGARINKLKETKDKLSKNVNMRAQNMRSKIEEQYQDLLKKKSIVENDRAKIVAVIKELDEKKNQALKEAWEKVNEDFGSIFSTLLPGAQAKLLPPEGMTVLDGLEFKVGFGNVWKESLSELSGGQRSLVALSLILALLLFKPAPIYILDEVDAALDLSHTQNIGQMLRNHFKHSQFIVVSLKEGMFNNANVLFKTKFIDGMSTVTRIAQRSSTSARR